MDEDLDGRDCKAGILLRSVTDLVPTINQPVHVMSPVPARPVTSNQRGSGGGQAPPRTSPLRLPPTLMPSASAARQKMWREASRLHNWLWIEAGGVCVLGGGLQVKEVCLIGGVPLSSDPSPFIPHPNKQWQTWRTQVPVSLMLYFNGLRGCFCSSVSGLDGESWDGGKVSPLKLF